MQNQWAHHCLSSTSDSRKEHAPRSLSCAVHVGFELLLESNATTNLTGGRTQAVT